MYAQIDGGSVVAYPVDIWRAHANVSFPIGWTGGIVEGVEYALVTPTTRPTADYTQNVTEGTPALTGCVWLQVWTVTSASPEEVSARIASQWSEVREQRNRKLYACDWTQLSDAPLSAEVKAEWVTYRQALRDVTQQADPFAIVWPVEP
jgi:hypothetical protein